jgi:hypothetical protein
MTQEEKDLLLKDICSRLPYKPIVQIDNCGIWNLRGVDHDNSAELRDRVIVWHGETYPSSKNSFPITDCKPYLFPLSRIYDNEELGKEFDGLIELELKAINDEIAPTQTTEFEVDFYNKHHLDWRGLIPMGLAIDATDKNIYNH